MKIMNYKDIVTSDDDDFLYDRLIELFNQIKLTQGGSGLDATLRRHPQIKNYCMAKQFHKIGFIEATYFTDEGGLDNVAIENYHVKNCSLQKVKVKVY